MTDNEPPQQRVALAPQATHEETLVAAGALYKALNDAGLGDIRPILDYARDVPYVKLHRIDANQATRLRNLVRRGMDGNYSLAEELRCAVLDHGLVNFPVPLVCGLDRIALGDISIHTADRLACILGAEPGTELAEVPDWPESNAVYGRLTAAFKAATDGAFMDMHLHSYCRRCDEDPAIELMPITLDVARRFVKALQDAPRP
ncbi:hypothetical protein OG863_00460 [Streptomyces decoyicus]|uniref:Mucin n=1 Tax=Streptomyces decoyicus TaxID=249567 RepID=A0ABZ1F926_9ACTN|nr:hypothetical protein [Streptomyces decoyicus]WSB66588.1 hypothetical protein OG863_00460 [Streptomyces decoyicus]